jgi:hypothetical protein
MSDLALKPQGEEHCHCTGQEALYRGNATDKKEAIDAIFEVIVQSRQAGEAEAVGLPTVGMATRNDLERFLAQEAGPFMGSAALASVLTKLAKALPADGKLDFLALKAATRRVPRQAGQRLEWVRTLGLDAALARHLPPGTLENG